MIVLVIDSGIDLNHPDLIPSLWVNPNPGPENGYDGDIHGWNFSNGTGNVQDSGWHGTHVSGTIAAATNNEIGIAGVAGGFGDNPGVRIMTAIGGQNLHSAFVYGSDNGAVISNNSWHVGVASQLLLDSITYFKETAGFDADGNPYGPIQGGVVIFSGGNQNGNNQFPPSVHLTDLVVVGSTDRNDHKSDFSNYGEWISVSAPGSSVISTIPPGILPGNTIYGTANGTSMAAPHVAGVASLIASHLPGLTSEEVRGRLATGVNNINEQNPDYVGMLGGRINAVKALLMNDPETPPTTITDLQTYGHIAEDHVWLQLTVPDVGGEQEKPFSYDIRISGQMITSENFYEAERVNLKTGPWFSGMTQTIKIEGLTKLTTYFVAIKSQDAFGNLSEISNTVEFTTDGSPAISVSNTEFLFELNFGESAVQSTEIQNTGDGTLFFSFPFNYQNHQLKTIDFSSPLISSFENHRRDDTLLKPIARNTIRKLRGGVRTGLTKEEDRIADYYEQKTMPPARYPMNDDPFYISSVIEFEEFTLEGYAGILVSDGTYKGLLREVVPDFVLEVNEADFWASDLALVFVSKVTGMPVLQIGGYIIYAPIMYPWLDGNEEEEGTPVTIPVNLDEPFDSEDMLLFMVNTYSPGTPASATWSGNITLVGLTEDEPFITEIYPASGSLLPGESVEVTFTAEASVTGNLANMISLRTNDLSTPKKYIITILNVARVISWANLEGPFQHSMEPGGSFDVYGSVLAALFTHEETPNPDIVFHAGFHHTDSDPSTWPEEAWIEGSFYEPMDDIHRYMLTTGDHLTQGTWYYATRFNFMNEGYTYGGFSESGGGIWDGIENVSGELTIQSSVNTGHEPELPQIMVLDQNYPNPFNPSTQIRFGLPETADVRLDVYNITGQRVATLVNGTIAAGYHTISFNAENLSSGVYLYTLHVKGTNERTIHKMTLIK